MSGDEKVVGKIEFNPKNGTDIYTLRINMLESEVKGLKEALDKALKDIKELKFYTSLINNLPLPNFKAGAQGHKCDCQQMHGPTPQGVQNIRFIAKAKDKNEGDEETSVKK